MLQKRCIGRFGLLLMLMTGCSAPGGKISVMQSGLMVGDDIVPWNPIHVAGPNAGTSACPICTYEARPGIQIFTRSDPNADGLAVALQTMVRKHSDEQLKGFVIVLDSTPDQLKQMAGRLGLKDIGLCYPDPQTRDSDLKKYKINPAVDNTVVGYRNYKVTGNAVNMSASDFGLRSETLIGKQD